MLLFEFLANLQKPMQVTRAILDPANATVGEEISSKAGGLSKLMSETPVPAITEIMDSDSITEKVIESKGVPRNDLNGILHLI